MAWYWVQDQNDPDGRVYASLPASVDLLPLTQAEWDAKETTPYILNGILVAGPGQSLSDAQSMQIADIQSAALLAQVAPLTFTNAANVTTSFPMDASAQMKYLGAYTRYVVHGATLPANFAFYDATGAAVVFTVTDIDNFATAGFGQVEAALEKQASLIAQIEAATTVAAVQAIVW